MNEKDKQQIDALISSRFAAIGNVNADAVKANQALRGKLAEIKKFEATFSDQENASRRDKAQGEYKQVLRSMYENVVTQLEELHDAINQRHGNLDMSDPRWANTLKMIELGVSDLDTIARLTKQFEHNQPALQALQNVYKARGFTYDGGLSEMVYDVEGSFNGLNEAAYQTFMMGNGSITAFASRVAKIANSEGFPFQASPDPDAFETAMYAGAGLPVPTE